MYSNELLRTKIVGQTGERAILWQQRGAYRGRPTDVHARRALKFGGKTAVRRNAELKAVRRLPAVRAGQGWPLRLCVSRLLGQLFAAGARPGWASDKRRWGGCQPCETRIPSAVSQLSQRASLYADALTRGAQRERMLIVVDRSFYDEG